MELAVFLVMAAGFAMILGARAGAGACLQLALCSVLVLSFVRCLIARLDLSFEGAHTGGSWFWATTTVLLALIGYVAWRTREARESRRDARRRRDGAPRERELPVLREPEDGS